jgi:hypothetical protein
MSTLTLQLAKVDQEIFRLEAAITHHRAWVEWNRQRAQSRSVPTDMITSLQESLELCHRTRRRISDELARETPSRSG